MNGHRRAEHNTVLSIAFISLVAATFAVSCHPLNPFYRATKALHEWGQNLAQHLPQERSAPPPIPEYKEIF